MANCANCHASLPTDQATCPNCHYYNRAVGDLAAGLSGNGSASQSSPTSISTFSSHHGGGSAGDTNGPVIGGVGGQGGSGVTSGFPPYRSAIGGEYFGGGRMTRPATEGVIAAVDRSRDENPNFDPWILLFFAMLILNGLALIAIVRQFLLVLILLLIVFFLIFRFLPLPGLGGCLTALPLIGMIFRNHTPEQVPVTFYTVSVADTQMPRRFRVKGVLNNPPILRETIRVWGQLREGVVQFERGEIINPENGTADPVRLNRRPSRFLILGLFLLGIDLIIYSWVSGLL